jgi:hypothetical protein
MRAMKEHGEEEIQNHSFVTSPLDGGEWSALHPGNFTLGKSPPVPTEIWMGPAAGAGTLKKILLFWPWRESIQDSSDGHLLSQSQYQLLWSVSPNERRIKKYVHTYNSDSIYPVAPDLMMACDTNSVVREKSLI